MTARSDAQPAHDSSGDPGEDTRCSHHWLIESPAGPVSKGTCRKCGAEREFANVLDSVGWEDFTLERDKWRKAV